MSDSLSAYAGKSSMSVASIRQVMLEDAVVEQVAAVRSIATRSKRAVSDISSSLNAVSNEIQVIPDEVPSKPSTIPASWWKDTYVSLSTQQDWWTLWIGIVCLVPCIVAGAAGASGSLVLHKWPASPLDAWSPRTGLGVTIAFVLFNGLFAAESLFCKKSKQLFSLDAAFAYAGVFVLALLSFWLDRNETLNQLGMSYALWSFVLGFLLGNLLPTPMSKLAPMFKQAEFFIKVGVVLLAQPLEDIGDAGGRGLAVAWGETLITWHLLVAIGVFGFKLDPRIVVTLATGIGICGASAATAAAATMGCPCDDLIIAVALISVFSTIAMLSLPYLASRVLGFGSAQTGAALAGSVDATGNVVAAAALVDDEAEAVAVIVKMAQNMLLPVIIVLISVYKDSLLAYNSPPAPESTDEATECKDPPSGKKSEKGFSSFFAKLWAGFPKFVVGYLFLCILLSILRVALPATTFVIMKDWQRGTSKWWFAIGFVGVGLSTNISELRKKASMGRIFMFAAAAELIDFVLTFLVAGLVFS